MTRSAHVWITSALLAWVAAPPVLTAAPNPPRPRAALAPIPAAAPDPLTASATSGSVSLTWTAVPGASAYRVYRAVSGVWDATAAVRTTNTTYRQWNLLNGVTYSYKVVALSSGGEGPPSGVVSATPLGAPTEFTATAGDTKATLNWLATPGATAYSLYRGSSSTTSTMVAVAEGLAAPGFVDTGLTNGTNYYYRVRALAPNSIGPASPAVKVKPLPPPPSTAPGNLTATPGNAKVYLTWTAVDGVTGYRIFRTTTGVWEGSPIASTSQLKFANTGLTNGITYQYRVVAYAQGGNGPYSNEVSATPTAPPPAPTGVSATGGNRQVSLSWNPVAEATTYAVYRGTTSGRQLSAAIVTGLTLPSFVDTGVENGPTYFYKVVARNAGGESARSEEVQASPEAPAPASDPETVAAFRLLRQATWGPRPGDVDLVKSMGADAFVSAQISAPASVYPDALKSMPVEAAQEHFMALALTGSDQLRQRVAWALHKMWVVSAIEVPSATGLVTYHRLLINGALGNYRDLMREITLNPAMGRYLNMLNNKSQAITGTPPNENYPRELMQLFTLGLTTLQPNGAPVLVGGQPVPTYTERDVKELARILTGWTFGDGRPAAPTDTAYENYGVPMEAVERFHDTGGKTFLGQEFAAGQTARQDLDQALDALFNHPNIGPFVSRQLIQQLVTSNPSPTYVGDVAAVFNGGGTRGDLAAVVRAILTHPEARTPSVSSGKLSEPALFVVSVLRALNASVTDHPFMSDKSEAMGQKVFYPPSVFSYFSPGFRVRGTVGPSGAPLGGPEFQILTTITAVERTNFVADLLAGYFGADASFAVSPFTSLANDPAALVDYCNLLLMGGQMSVEERTEIIGAVRASPPTSPGDRARTAIYLTLAVAQAQVDR